MTARLGAITDRLCELQFSLEKVDGTLATILNVGNVESMNQPSPKDVLSTLQLLVDVVTPACEELGEIIREVLTQSESPTLPQGEKARVKTKGRGILTCLLDPSGFGFLSPYER
jgi:hypothetical protein